MENDTLSLLQMSELVFLMDTRKEFPVNHPKPLNLHPAIMGLKELASPMPGNIASPVSPPAISKRTTLLPHIDSSCPLIPYVSGIQVHLPVAAHIKVAENGSCGGATESELDIEEDTKPEREHKKRSKNWTRLEILKLIKLRSHLAPMFIRAGRKSELWEEIAEALKSRDAQQCRDKWEKLMAAYKEVRDGLKDKEDSPYYDELHLLLAGNASKGEKEREKYSIPHESLLDVLAQWASSDTGEDYNLNAAGNYGDGDALEITTLENHVTSDENKILEQGSIVRKRKQGTKFGTTSDLHVIQTLLETLISKQQRFFGDFLDALERKKQARERMREEVEDKWRIEERAQRNIFNNAMLVLTQKLVGERQGAAVQAGRASLVSIQVENQGPKKRSKNWKQTEVLQLIKLRGEMEIRFAKSTRRAALWDELAELLANQGIQRDGKQCKEKWDKLMSGHKYVVDGKRQQHDSPYFSELTVVVGKKPVDSQIN